MAANCRLKRRQYFLPLSCNVRFQSCHTNLRNVLVLRIFTVLRQSGFTVLSNVPASAWTNTECVIWFSLSSEIHCTVTVAVLYVRVWDLFPSLVVVTLLATTSTTELYILKTNGWYMEPKNISVYRRILKGSLKITQWCSLNKSLIIIIIKPSSLLMTFYLNYPKFSQWFDLV